MDSMHSFSTACSASTNVRLPLSRSFTTPRFLITNSPPPFGSFGSTQDKFVQNTASHPSPTAAGPGEESGVVN